MKRILTCLLCFVLMCAPLTAYAEEGVESTVETTTGEVVENTPVEDETPVDEEIEGDVTTDETPNDENAPAEEGSSNGDIPEDSKDVEGGPVETPTEDENEEDVPVDTPTDDTTETPSEDVTDVPTDTPADEPVDAPTETPTDEPVDTPTDEPVDTPTDEPIVDTPAEETPVEEVKMTPSDMVAKWFEANADTISIVLSFIFTCVVIIKKVGDILKATGIINDNAVTIATNSEVQIKEAKELLEKSANAVVGYDSKIAELLTAFSLTLSENKALKGELVEMKSYLHTSALSSVELGNIIAELLSLADIPNFKKDEMGTRHLEALSAILDAEQRATVALENLITPTEMTPVEEVQENEEA